MYQLKSIIKQQKLNYNKEIKEYQILTKTILSEEQKVEDVEKFLNKTRYKQKMMTMNINSDFVKHFKDFASRMDPEIMDGLIEFFGYFLTPFGLIKVN